MPSRCTNNQPKMGFKYHTVENVIEILVVYYYEYFDQCNEQKEGCHSLT